MDSVRRFWSRGLLALGAVAALLASAGAVRAAPPWIASSKTMAYSVHPAPGSVLEFDDPPVLAARDALSALLLTNPSCPADKVRDQLRAKYGAAVKDVTFPPDYVFHWKVDHWVHDCTLSTQFTVDLGSRRTIEVDVDQSEVKN